MDAFEIKEIELSGLHVEVYTRELESFGHLTNAVCTAYKVVDKDNKILVF